MLRIAVLAERFEAERNAENVEELRTADRRAAAPHERHLPGVGVDKQRVEDERKLFERRPGIREPAVTERREGGVVGQSQDKHAGPLPRQRRPPLRLLRMQMNQFDRFVAAEIALHPLIRQRRHPESLVELRRRPRPPRGHALLPRHAGMLLSLRPIGRDWPEPRRIAPRVTADDRPVRKFEIRHPFPIGAKAERVASHTGTAPRTGKRERDRTGVIRRPGLVEQLLHVPCPIAVHGYRFPPSAHPHTHGIPRRDLAGRRMGRTDDDHLAEWLSRHEV